MWTGAQRGRSTTLMFSVLGVLMAGVREIVLLTLGWEELPSRCLVYGAPEHERLRAPAGWGYSCARGGWLLLDTGFTSRR